MELSSKQRAHLKSIAQTEDTLFRIGKNSLESSFVDAIREAFNKREIIKIAVLKNCIDDIYELGKILAERTDSTLVQLIGRKIVLYKPFSKNPVIILPK